MISVFHINTHTHTHRSTVARPLLFLCYCCLWFFEIDFNIYRYHLRCGVNVFIQHLACLFGIWLDCVSEMLILVLTIIKINCIIISHTHSTLLLYMYTHINQRPIHMGLFVDVLPILSLSQSLSFSECQFLEIDLDCVHAFHILSLSCHAVPCHTYYTRYYLSYVHKSLCPYILLLLCCCCC